MIIAYTDSNYANNSHDRRSISEMIVIKGCCIISWASKKQDIVALNLCEAEYITSISCAQKILFIQQLMDEIDLTKETEIMYRDNNQAIFISRHIHVGPRTDQTHRCQIPFHSWSHHSQKIDICKCQRRGKSVRHCDKERGQRMLRNTQERAESGNHIWMQNNWNIKLCAQYVITHIKHRETCIHKVSFGYPLDHKKSDKCMGVWKPYFGIWETYFCALEETRKQSWKTKLWRS